MNAIAPVNMAMGEMWQLAQAIAKSSLFGMKTPEQALVLMSIAQAEGRHPALAARDYDIIQNRPAKKAEAMLRDFLEGGGKVEWHALTDAVADATFSHPQGGSVRITWDMARAVQAGLGGKPTWKQFPRQMLRSRVVSEGVRTVYPLATSGLYVPEEAADMPAKEPHNGPTIEHEAKPSERDRINADIPLRAAAAATPRGARIAERAPEYEAPAKPVERTDEAWQVWIDKLRAACAALYHRSEVVEVAERPSVADALATSPEWVKREISAILAENYKRFPEPAEAKAEEAWPGDDLEIKGEDKIMAGD